jgi:alpha-N-arabinofuranosidase
MVNVLQAMILTDGPRMALTPTYHAFQMYQPFQGASALKVNAQVPDYVSGANRMPALDITAAKGASGNLEIGIVNVDPNKSAELDLSLLNYRGRAVEGLVLTAARMDSRNGLDGRKEVAPQRFGGFAWRGEKLRVEVPAKSVVRLTLRQRQPN